MTWQQTRRPRRAPDGGAKQRGGLGKFLFVHEIDEYPGNGKRTAYLALAVLATIVLYYTYFTQTGVTPNILVSYHMSFSFYVWIVVISNADRRLRLAAGVQDRQARAGPTS